MFCVVDTALPKYGSDLHPELMALWAHVQEGGPLPTVITEADYAAAQRGDGPAWWRGFIGFGCSFGGKWMGGFARGDGDRNYAMNASNGLNKLRPRLAGTALGHRHYQIATLYADHAVIYCDPPYAATTGYQRGGFDHDQFWSWVRAIATHNIVLISEYAAPDDIPCIAEFPKKMGLRSKDGGQEVRTERLFRVGPVDGW